ncbi:MAG: AbrB/MazE/SpoVT family DNA-binding domain-containing protein [Synergistaceae bacterium]|jgi:AbrB family looped-hinge helix DNA binding protein|nr:AbrB/MazE/SpoVT family DNA-binding domain-containing protein [Synergistaceae bacterium]
MPDVLTVSAKGQITLPSDLRLDFGLNEGDKVFAEKMDIGYVIKRPKKGLLEYAGFIKDTYDPEKDLAFAIDAAAAHILGEDEC